MRKSIITAVMHTKTVVNQCSKLMQAKTKLQVNPGNEL